MLAIFISFFVSPFVSLQVLLKAHYLDVTRNAFSDLEPALVHRFYVLQVTRSGDFILAKGAVHLFVVNFFQMFLEIGHLAQAVWTGFGYGLDLIGLVRYHMAE